MKLEFKGNSILFTGDAVGRHLDDPSACRELLITICPPGKIPQQQSAGLATGNNLLELDIARLPSGLYYLYK